MRNKRGLWSIVWFVICLFMIMSSTITLYAAETNTEEEGKLIYFIYDNSTSMIREYIGNNNYSERKWGAQAQYAVKAFCAMSNPKDEIVFYKIGDELGAESYGNINKSDSHTENIEQYIDKLQGIEFDGGTTFYDQIGKAIDDMDASEFKGEKWIVMFTDGAIEQKDAPDYTEEEFYKKLSSDMTGKNFKFYYVNINPEPERAESFKMTNENIIWYRMADKENPSILDSILTVTEEVYGKRRLPEEFIVKDTENLKISFDIPVSNVMLLLQGAENTESFSWNSYMGNSVESFMLKGEAVGDSDNNGDNELIPGPTGIILNADNLLSEDSGQYFIEIPLPKTEEGAAVENIECVAYYTPDVSVSVSVASISSTESTDVVKEGKYVEGNYHIGVQLLDENTGTDVNDSKLLAGETYGIEMDGGAEGKVQVQDVPINETISSSFSEGSSEISVETSWGMSAELSVKMEDNLEDYKLELKTQDTTFYYNRLNEKENGIIATLKDANGNTLEGFRDMDIEIEFLCDGELCDEVKYDKDYDKTQDAWIIYPLLKDEEDRDISGDLQCKAVVTTQPEYYEEPYSYEEELLLDMEVDGKLEVVIPEKIEDSWRLLFSSRKIPIKYVWNGQEVEVDEIQTTVRMVYTEQEKETIFEDETAKIEWDIAHWKEAPVKIQVKPSAVYTAHGERFPLNEKEVEIKVEEILLWEKMVCGLIIILIIFFIIITAANIVISTIWKCQERRFDLNPKVNPHYIDSIATISKQVKTKYECNLWVFLKRYYTEIILEVQNTEIMIELEVVGNAYKLRRKGNDTLWNLTVDGKKIRNDWLMFDKSSNEILLEVPEVGTIKIEIQFGGKR